MRGFLTAVVAAVLFGVARAAESDKFVLDAKNYDSLIGGKKHVLLKAYAPWCGHCKALVPTWADLAGVFKDEGNVEIAVLDCTVEESVASLLEIRGYPTLLYFAPGSKKAEKYEGLRALSDLVTFINGKAGTFRKKNGGLDDSIGRVKMFDKVIHETSCTSGATIAECAKSLLTALGSVKVPAEPDSAKQKMVEKIKKYYTKALTTMQEKPQWIKDEMARLRKLTSEKQEQVEESQLNWAMARKNILVWIEKKINAKLEGKNEEKQEL